MEYGISYCFDDVLMEPLYSNIVSRSLISLETNIGSNGRNLVLKTPLISSPMDTVTEQEMAIQMALNGGLGIIHRFMSIDTQVQQVINVKRFLQYIIQKPYCITLDATYDDIEQLIEKYNVFSFCVVSDLITNDFIGIITRRDIQYMKLCIINNPCMDYKIRDIINNANIIKLDANILSTMDNTLTLAKELMLQNRIEKIPIVSGNKLTGLITLKNIRHYEDNKNKACIDLNGALCVGAAIGIVGDYLERLDKLIVAGADLICVDVANGFNKNLFIALRDIRYKYPNIVVMAGNVCNWEGFVALANCDVDCIRIGIGNGSICTTRGETGIGKGQITSIRECFDYKINNNIQSKIISDGGSTGKTGNKAKALACGSTAIMLGRTLASTDSSPGQIIIRNGRRFKYIRGMASTMANISKQERLDDETQEHKKIHNTEKNKKKKIKTIHSEGVDGYQELSGCVDDVLAQINGGLRSSMSYLGCESIAQLHEKNARKEIKFNIVTSTGVIESNTRVKTF